LLQRPLGIFAPEALAVYGMASENPENKRHPRLFEIFEMRQ
jgi:hypothetical protein